MTLAHGTQIDGYKIEVLVGLGSMGEVYRAQDTFLERVVAVKILSAKHRGNVQLQARFVREARALASVTHGNVVQVFFAGRYEGRPYMAMEYLVGDELETLVSRQGPLDTARACLAIRDAAMGLCAASEAGVIHRDVKPANLIMLGTGQVKVTDFGLAKPIDLKGPALTQLGMVVGTPDYIAPEQARGETVNERADIYGLGGTMYFLLTGTPPYRTGDPNKDRYADVMARHLTCPIPNPGDRRSDVPDDVADLVMRMMAKTPGERPSYSAVIRRLLTLAGVREPAKIPALAEALEARDQSPTMSSMSSERALTYTEPEPASAAVAGPSVGGGAPGAPAMAPRPVAAAQTVGTAGARWDTEWPPQGRSRMMSPGATVVTLLCVGLFLAGLAVTLAR